MNVEPITPRASYYTDILSPEESVSAWNEFEKWRSDIEKSPIDSPVENYPNLPPDLRESMLTIATRTRDEYIARHGIEDSFKMVGVDVICRNLPGHVNMRHADTYDENYLNQITHLIYVNDDYDGGELSFSENEELELNADLRPDDVKLAGTLFKWIKPKRFSSVIFPSYQLHTAHKQVDGSKYLVKITWPL